LPGVVQSLTNQQYESAAVTLSESKSWPINMGMGKVARRLPDTIGGKEVDESMPGSEALQDEDSIG
jgi:hypothetical protein